MIAEALAAQKEGWRYTPAATLTGPDFKPAGVPESILPLAGRVLCPVGFHRAALVNGRWEAKHAVLKLPDGVTVEPLARASGLEELLGRLVPDDLPLAKIASAARDGFVVRVARHARVDRPIHLVHISQATAAAQSSQARVVVVLEPGASAELVEETLSFGDAPSWKNVRSQVELGEGSFLRHHRIVREGTQGRLTVGLEVTLASRARYESHALNFGGLFAREDLRVRLEGEGAECALNGLALLGGSEFADHHSIVEHAAVNGVTRQLYKAVIDDKARYVFDGLISVKPGAQKTDAQVYNKNLLLSEEARVNTNPEFKILADDVSCKHGGAVGQLSLEALFYLRSRGIGADEARRLLVYAFGSEMVDRVALEPLKLALADALHGRMPEGNL
ncbi:MAG: Fe-S cluster assembly protein SufD [Elusimicrobiota bacterium]|nr:Fe-S cluster assembly protein SufD [Elusimicrobiota bacterium]